MEGDVELLPEIIIPSDEEEGEAAKEADVREVNKVSKPNEIAAKETPQENSAKEKFIDFEKYVQETYGNHIKILQRSSFANIQRPIFIAFNHFREKCAHHLYWLEAIYKLSQKYGEEIEFIVADQMDMDVIYPNTNPIDYFSCFIRPEEQDIQIFVRDKKGRMLQFFDAYKTDEVLMELCCNLISGNLFISQAIPEMVQDNILVKICVHLNFNDLVANSSKDILLIVGLDDYRPAEEGEPNYEQLAKEFKDSNLDIVYIDGDRNFIPFEYYVGCYPTILFIPHDEKQKIIRFEQGPRDTENLRIFIQQNIGPQGKQLRHQEIEKSKYKPFTLPPNDVRRIQFENLQEYLNENFTKSFQVLDRHTFSKIRKCIIIYFMDFKSNDVRYYLQWLQLIHQVAHGRYGYSTDFLVGDLQDIDVIYPKWYHKYMDELHFDSTKPHIYAIDFCNHTYKIEEDFKTSAALCYFTFELERLAPYFSQARHAIINSSTPVTSCIADNFNIFIKNYKCHKFLTVHWDESPDMEKLTKFLNEIAEEFPIGNVKFLKIDAKLNYLPLEYRCHTYPVHFYIPENNPEEDTVRYISCGRSKNDILTFLQSMLKT